MSLDKTMMILLLNLLVCQVINCCIYLGRKQHMSLTFTKGRDIPWPSGWTTRMKMAHILQRVNLYTHHNIYLLGTKSIQV